MIYMYPADITEDSHKTLNTVLQESSVIRIVFFLLDFFQIFAEEIAFFHIYGLNTGIGCQPCTVLE